MMREDYGEADLEISRLRKRVDDLEKALRVVWQLATPLVSTKRDASNARVNDLAKQIVGACEATFPPPDPDAPIAEGSMSGAWQVYQGFEDKAE